MPFMRGVKALPTRTHFPVPDTVLSLVGRKGGQNGLLRMRF
jgi:hypothetical protein